VTRSLVTTLVLLASSHAAHADFAPTVLDRFDGSVSHTVTRDLGYSGGAGDIAGAIWTGFGVSTGTKSFRANIDASSTGYAADTVFGSMQQTGGALRLGLSVPAGAVLAGGGSTPTNARVTYAGSFDLSGKGGSFFFHIASTSATDTSLGIAILSGGTAYASVVASGSSGPRYVELAFTMLRSASGAAYAGDGSAISEISLGFAANTSISGDRTAGLYEFGVVPTPATAALLGAALLAPLRRRR